MRQRQPRRVGEPGFVMVGTTNTIPRVNGQRLVDSGLSDNGTTVISSRPLQLPTTTGIPVQNGAYRLNHITGWVRFNGGATGTIAVQTGQNVVSITDNGTGNYTVKWARSFSGNYAGYGSALSTGENLIVTPAAYTASTTQFRVTNDAGTLRDSSVVSFFVVGNQ